TVRGDRGEIVDQTATFMQDHMTPVTVEFQRATADSGTVLTGIQAGGEWQYRNPLAPAHLDDEDIAVGDCMLRMAEYADGGDAFYSLAEACQDRYLDIMIWQSAESGQPVTTTAQV